MPAIIAMILGVFGKFLTDKLLMFVAVKALIIGVFVVILPIILQNFFTWVIEQMVLMINSNLSPESQLEAFTINLTGVAAYLGDCFQLPLCVSILLSAMLLRLTMNFIPFIR